MKIATPIIFLDLETTGLDIVSDKIVSLTAIKFMPDKTQIKKSYLINPQRPIPKVATDIHGITDEMVKDKPTFKDLAKELYAFMNGCDLIGYNNHYFDNPLLQEEFFVCGYDFPNCENTRSIDLCYIFKHFEKRDLASALRHYCQEDLVNGHTSDADAEATIKIFFAQIERHAELRGKNIDDLAKFCNPNNRADWQEKVLKDGHGGYLYNFGKEKGRKVSDNIGYCDWILGSGFPAHFKGLMNKVKNKILGK